MRVPDWVLVDAPFFNQFSPYSPPPFSDLELDEGCVTRGPFILEIGKTPKTTVVGLNLQFAETPNEKKKVFWWDGEQMAEVSVKGKILKNGETLRFLTLDEQDVVVRKITADDARYVFLDPEETPTKMLTKDLIEAIRKRYL